MNIENIKKAIEDDAGEMLPDLEKSLKELVAGQHDRINTPPGVMLKLAEIALHHPEIFKNAA